MGNTNFGRDFGSTPTVNGAPVSTANPQPVTVDNGTAITGATMPAGGVGPLGWLSAIWYRLTNGITVNAGTGPATPWGVSLDAASLAALETTELGATTLAALETTELGATTLAALETTTTLDGGPAWTSVWGVAGVPFASADQHSAVANVTDAPTSGQKLVITDLIVSVDTNMSVTFKEEASGIVMFGPWYCSANSGPIQVTLRSKKKLAAADKKLQVLTSVAGNITVQAGYFSEA